MIAFLKSLYVLVLSLNSGTAFQICSVSKSVYLTACFFLSVSNAICARVIRSSKSSKNRGSSRGREVSNFGAVRSLRVGIAIGVAIAVMDGIKLIGNGMFSEMGYAKSEESDVSLGIGLRVLGVFGVEDCGVCRCLIGVRGVVNEGSK